MRIAPPSLPPRHSGPVTRDLIPAREGGEGGERERGENACQ